MYVWVFAQIKKLRQQNEDLQNKVDLLTEEKQRLEECVNSLNHKVDTLNQSIQNMQNHNDSIKQDMEQVSIQELPGKRDTPPSLDSPSFIEGL